MKKILFAIAAVALLTGCQSFGDNMAAGVRTMQYYQQMTDQQNYQQAMMQQQAQAQQRYWIDWNQQQSQANSLGGINAQLSDLNQQFRDNAMRRNNYR